MKIGKKLRIIMIILLFSVLCALPARVWSQASASWNYGTQTGTIGTTYSWIDCSSGTTIVIGDDTQTSINWPFNFTFYNNDYTPANSLSVASNGFIRLDGIAAGNNYTAASAYDLTANATGFGQIIATSMYDGYLGRIADSWCKYLVTGTAPNRIFTIESHNIEIDYNDGVYADVQVSFYETTNEIVLKLGTDNISVDGVDMGIHSGVFGFFNKWQEVRSGTNNTWIRYMLPVELTSTNGTLHSYYPNLKTAFDKINDGTHRGNVTIQIRGNTTETASAVLNASGTGSADYVSVNIYPTITDLSISGSLTSPLIDLNGADNVTIDGRVNATGATRDLTITNISTSSTAGTSTIRLINNATNNSVKYCTIKGSETVAASGVIFFSTANSGTGNNNNTIDNNNITNAANASRPVNAIFSSGTLSRENAENIISNNNIYDFHKHGTASNGIFLSSNSTAWSITGNSFYETTSFIPTGAVTFSAIQINNTSGSGYIITDNYIGGNTFLGGGTAWTKTNNNNNAFNAIYLNVGTAMASSVQNNTIKNFDWRNSGTGAWTGINVIAGNVDIGTVTGNTIGESTGNGSITVTSGTSGQTVYGINIAGTGIVDCQNNNIGSITSVNTNTGRASNIYGINRTAAAGTTTISNNTIGSTTTSNSIFASSPSTAIAQIINGISSDGTGTITISGNIISNLTNAVTGTLTSQTTGIETSAGSNTIINNTLFNISTSSGQIGTAVSAAAMGIVQRSTTAGTAQTVNGNTIYSISNTNTSARVSSYGIYYSGPASGTNSVSNNFIHGLTLSSSNISSVIDGIYLNSGLTIIANNIINLGSGITTGYLINGIWDNSGALNNNSIWFNSVYIGGTVSGTTSATAALWNAANTSIRDYRNNILFNARSGGATGKHYAIRLAGITNLTIDYNDYYAPNTNGVLGYIGADRTTLALFQAATGQDANSLDTDPLFASAGGTMALDYYSSAVLPGVSGTGITTDFSGLTRNTIPKMGAFEVNSFVWTGSVSTDFGTAGNWTQGAVPPNGADIMFASDPIRSCLLDQDRSFKNITIDQSIDKLFVNGHQLTITGDLLFTNGAQIDATTTLSEIVFAGGAAQNIPAGALVSNTADAIGLNNINGLIINEDLTVTRSFNLTSGAFSIGANTLTLNGSISTAAGTLTGGSSSNIIMGGSGATTTLPAVVLNNLTLNRANGISLGGSVSVGGTLILTDGTLNLGANSLTISGNSPVRTIGNIEASDGSATLSFTNSSAITLPSSIFTGSVNNLTINGSGGIIASSDFTVNGILNLMSPNPSATKGSLAMDTFTLTLGANATTVGEGDVSGIVKRTSFVAGISYTFGNQYNTIVFQNSGTLPTEMSLRLTIGAAPAWKPDAIHRIYESIQTGASGALATTAFNYLDSELNGNTEGNLVIWSWQPGPPVLIEHGVYGSSTTQNWVGSSNFPVEFLPSAFGIAFITIANSQTVLNTWNGSASTDWNTPLNWTKGYVPLSTDDVIIPNTASLSNEPTMPASTTINSLTIQAGGVVNGGTGTVFTLAGGAGAWTDNGIFNPGTSTVVFTNALATVSGTTSFYNITLNSGAGLTPETNSITRIAGSLTNNGTLRATLFPNTIEYNGANQTVINPNGSTTGYYNLILSGTGNKTLPASELSIYGNITASGTISGTASADMNIYGNAVIGTGCVFNVGGFTFTIKGNITNNGSFVGTAGNTVILNGTASQSIQGTYAPNYYNLTVDNSAGVYFYNEFNIYNVLSLTNGTVNLVESTIGIYGTISRTSGVISINPLSSLSFGGTTAITVSGDLFATPPSIKNLTINRTGGVTFSFDLTVNGILNLQSANPSATKGSLDMWDGSADKILTMGADATNIGIGDVTGIITRNTILPNVTYTFGTPYTSVYFPNVGTLPTSISLKVQIGTAPSWKTGAVQRIHDIIQTGASGTLAIINAHYLDSELNGNDESSIVNWSYRFSGPILTEHGRSNFNTTENWISLANVNFAFFPSAFGMVEISPDESELTSLTWNGSVSTSWITAENWTPNGAPSDNTVVIIPDAATTPNDPVLPPFTACGTITLKSGAILNSGTGSQLTLNGASGVWSNDGGTFNAGDGTVIFTNPNATISGATGFYNLTLNSGAALSLSTNSVTRIAGALTNNGILRAAFTPNTLEYNGTDQAVIIPNGLTPGYYNLILSGTGTKTMPSDTLDVVGDFAMAGLAATTAAAHLNIFGDFTLGSGTSFTTGSLGHQFGGNFTNDGTFIASVGDTIEMNGSEVQYISGTSPISFNILDLDGISGAIMTTDITVDYLLEMDNGNLYVADNTLTINGNIAANGGVLDVTTQSSLTFGGTTSITLTGNMFTAPPVLNNLTVNRSGGVISGTDITVNGILNLQSANPSATKGALDMYDGSALKVITMGASATTVGIGDVTGIVRRDSFVAGIPYSFGNQFTTITFDANGDLPAGINLKIVIGSSPSWKPTAVNRIYDFIQDNSSSCTGTFRFHYLDSELNGNTEILLVPFLNGTPGPPAGIIQLEQIANDETDNWVEDVEIPLFFLNTGYGTLELTLADSELSIALWNGSLSTSWTEAGNWTPSGIPTAGSDVIIPDASTTTYSPTLPPSAEIVTLQLENDAILNAGTGSQLTINGSNFAWRNYENGTFNAGNSNVIFTNTGAFLWGTNSFHNLTVGLGATLFLPLDSYTKISGAIINNGTLEAGLIKNTIEYNGSDQTVINPNGSVAGYIILILSGSGVKTMPSTQLNVAYDFTLSGTATATANQDLVNRGDFTVGPSASFTTGPFNHDIGGFLENNGSFDATGSTITFNGTVQTIKGTVPVAFDNLTVATGSNTTVITAGQTLSGILLCNATLNSGGNITLLSTASNTALIDGTGTGQVLGNVIMQRYLPSGFGYKYFSSPFQAATVNEFADDINLAASSTAFYSYNENRYLNSTPLSGWYNYKTTTNILYPVSGYAVNLGSNSAANTIDITGNVNNGSLSVTLYNHDQIYTQGFNLVGNPYPSPIDWNALSGWTKDNIDNSLYFFKANTTDQYGGTYSTYINGNSSDAVVDNIIPSMQGFFVHVSDGAFPVTGTLSMDNEVRINNSTATFTKSAGTSGRSLLRVVAGYADNPDSYDPMVLYFDDMATMDFDGQLDALKLYNTDARVTNFYSISGNDYNISIKALPVTGNGIYTIPLGLKTNKNGEVIFRVSESQGDFAGKEIYFYDVLTGVNQELKPGNEYKIFLSAGEYKTRFFLKLADIETDITEVPADNDWFTVYAYHGILNVDVDLPEGENGTLTLFNIIGQAVFTDKIYETGHYEFNPGVKDGVYIVTFVAGNKRISEKIIITN